MSGTHLAYSNRARGFSLIENLVAMSLLTVGMLALTGMQITTISAGRFSSKMTQALMLAEQEASRLQALAWEASDLGGPAKSVLKDYAYGVSFDDPSYQIHDPSAVADRCEGLNFDANGKLSSVAVVGAMFQRCTQLDPEDLSTMIDGTDSLRIRVFVRFRDFDRAAVYRTSSVTVVKPKVF